VSPAVQAFPSSHGWLGLGALKQPVPGSQVSLVQLLASSQLTSVPLQVVPEVESHRSSVVQALPSSHAWSGLPKCWHPCCPKQKSDVHSF
jgi:hypothetical protein